MAIYFAISNITGVNSRVLYQFASKDEHLRLKLANKKVHSNVRILNPPLGVANPVSEQPQVPPEKSKRKRCAICPTNKDRKTAIQCDIFDHQQCGRPLESNLITKSDRIVSGYDVGYYKYPWYAALIQTKQVSCGGALIGPKLVVTAAHCYKEYLEKANKSLIKLEHIYTVRLGMYNICATAEKTAKEFAVEKVQIHELYPTKMPYYDICLLTLSNGTEGFEPLCLPNKVINVRPKDGTVPGMGTLKYQGAMPCTLHEARLLIYPDGTCVDMINSTGNNGSDVKNAFCAGYLSGGIDTCQGDSGGPLQILDNTGRYVLFGIVSFGFHCALPKYLGMYTDVSQYIDWIREKSGGLDLPFITPNGSDEEYSDGHKKKHHQHGHRQPVRIIILRNKKRTRG
ncbi:proclotting enzyme-like isoform X2 [Anthonomus grandis grandis]|uniref:proclotting enzyme-like isoform X2 n=1 Tax=Anthonomus grandis grandis TaxID=2921223 RepID=UPI002165B8F3|nr:proclotting enzyme-like isoform X2 [Anthonomus grandis grandis]